MFAATGQGMQHAGRPAKSGDGLEVGIGASALPEGLIEHEQDSPFVHFPGCATTNRNQMKLPRSAYSARNRSDDERGTAVIVLLFLLAILLIYIGGTLRTLDSLGRQLRILEQRQNRRLESFARTNVFAGVRAGSAFEPGGPAK
jgi:hypothetical protein